MTVVTAVPVVAVVTRLPVMAVVTISRSAMPRRAIARRCVPGRAVGRGAVAGSAAVGRLRVSATGRRGRGRRRNVPTGLRRGRAGTRLPAVEVGLGLEEFLQLTAIEEDSAAL